MVFSSQRRHISYRLYLPIISIFLVLIASLHFPAYGANPDKKEYQNLMVPGSSDILSVISDYGNRPFKEILIWDLDKDGRLSEKDIKVFDDHLEELKDSSGFDIDMNGQVNVTDVLWLSMLVGDRSPGTGWGILDSNGDGYIDELDYRVDITEPSQFTLLVKPDKANDLISKGWQAYFLPEPEVNIGALVRGIAIEPHRWTMILHTPGLYITPFNTPEPAEWLHNNVFSRGRKDRKYFKKISSIWNLHISTAPPEGAIPVENVVIDSRKGRIEVRFTGPASEAIGSRDAVIMNRFILRGDNGEIVPLAVPLEEETSGTTDKTSWLPEKWTGRIFNKVTGWFVSEAWANGLTITQASTTYANNVLSTVARNQKKIQKEIQRIAEEIKKKQEEVKEDPECLQLDCKNIAELVNSFARLFDAIRATEIMAESAVDYWDMILTNMERATRAIERGVGYQKSILALQKAFMTIADIASLDFNSVEEFINSVSETAVSKILDATQQKLTSSETAKLTNTFAINLTSQLTKINIIERKSIKVGGKVVEKLRFSKDILKVEDLTKKPFNLSRIEKLGKGKAMSANIVASVAIAALKTWASKSMGDVQKRINNLKKQLMEAKKSDLDYKMNLQVYEGISNKTYTIRKVLEKTKDALTNALDECAQKARQNCSDKLKAVMAKAKKLRKQYDQEINKLSRQIRKLEKEFDRNINNREKLLKKVQKVHRELMKARNVAFEERMKDEDRQFYENELEEIEKEIKRLHQEERKLGIDHTSTLILLAKKRMDIEAKLRKMGKKDKGPSSAQKKVERLTKKRKELWDKIHNLKKNREDTFKQLSDLRNQREKLMNKSQREYSKLTSKARSEFWKCVKVIEKDTRGTVSRRTVERSYTREAKKKAKMKKKQQDMFLPEEIFTFLLQAQKDFIAKLASTQVEVKHLNKPECSEEAKLENLARDIAPKGKKTVTLIQVIPLSGNNPFNPEDPISEGGTTGSGETTPGGTTTGEMIQPCSAGPTAMDTEYIGVNFSYIETTGECELQPGIYQSSKFLAHGAYIFLLRGPSNACDGGCLQMGNSFWSLVSSSAGTGAPGQFASIQNIPLNTPVDIVVQCTGAGCPAGNPMYTGTIIITPTTGEVRNFRPQ